MWETLVSSSGPCKGHCAREGAWIAQSLSLYYSTEYVFSLFLSIYVSLLCPVSVLAVGLRDKFGKDRMCKRGGEG